MPVTFTRDTALYASQFCHTCYKLFGQFSLCEFGSYLADFNNDLIFLIDCVGPFCSRVLRAYMVYRV